MAFDWVLVWDTTGADGTNLIKTTHIAEPRPPKEGADLEAYLLWVEIKDRPSDAIGLPARIKLAELPEGRRFSTAWRLDRSAAKVVLHAPTMRAVILEEVRHKRNDLLTESDKEKNRLDDEGTNQQKQVFRDYRKSLRDLPATVAAQLAGLNTPEALEAYQPVFPTAP